MALFTCDPYAVRISAPKDLLHAVPEVVEVVHGHRDHLVLNRPRKPKEAVQDFVTEHGQDPSEVEVRPGYAEVIVLFFEGVQGLHPEDESSSFGQEAPTEVAAVQTSCRVPLEAGSEAPALEDAIQDRVEVVDDVELELGLVAARESAYVGLQFL